MKKICYSYFHHWMMFLLGNKIEYDNSLWEIARWSITMSGSKNAL